jgi:hypothetical protein
MSAAAGKALAGIPETISAESVRQLWEVFRRRICAVVRECNCEAGEAMWGMVEESGEMVRLRVWDQTNISSHVELILDFEHALLTCDFGKPPQADRWVFCFQPDSTLRGSGADYQMDDAVRVILDRLISA